jgi:polyribonucleotide nucleotidyltransferase
MDKKTSVTLPLGGTTLTLETGSLAPQASASILARLGDTVVLATVVEGNLREDIDYFPLSVEFVERLYAGGRIKGSRWVKREGRPSDEAVLSGRLIDRSIRPLFPKEYKNEVQVMATVLSVDGENEPDILALIAVSAAISISRIPWNGPVGAIRMGYVRDPEGKQSEYISNPTRSQLDYSDLDVVATQTKEKTLMLESGAKQVPEDIMLEAIKRAHIDNDRVIELINELTKKVGQKKVTVTPNTTYLETVKKIEKSYKEDIAALAAARANKEAGGNLAGELVNKIYEEEKMRDPSGEVDKKLLAKAVEYVMFQMIRSDVITKKKRADGRKVDEIRPISAQVSVLPRTHGSAIFQRGLTQALTVATLGSPRLEQLIESAEGEESKRYIHHYSMPPYSVGEAGRAGFTSRREIGHGALAERALEPVIPGKDVFPYTIRLVSEILSSNGSTSMASTCGSTLALMDAGVPITKPVAGISIGMMSDEKDYVLLTDIIGLEDFSGDMDFKVAGTEDGITAIQLDVKIPGLTDKQVEEILAAAKTARMFILEKMLATLPQSRSEVSEFAPKIEMVQIPVDKIGELIGPGGKIIKNIIAQTGATVDVEDDGTVTVSGTDEEAVQKALDWVKGIVREVQPGEIFEGPVKRILPFGAFVEFLPGKEGMVHVSKMAKGFVKNPEEVVTIGQSVKVRVAEIDDQGRINLSMFLDPAEEPARQERPMGDRPERSDHGDRPPFRRINRDRQEGGFAANDRRSDHPLSRQFQRERGERRSGGFGGPKKRFSR